MKYMVLWESQVLNKITNSNMVSYISEIKKMENPKFFWEEQESLTWIMTH